MESQPKRNSLSPVWLLYRGGRRTRGRTAASYGDLFARQLDLQESLPARPQDSKGGSRTSQFRYYAAHCRPQTPRTTCGTTVPFVSGVCPQSSSVSRRRSHRLDSPLVPVGTGSHAYTRLGCTYVCEGPELTCERLKESGSPVDLLFLFFTSVGKRNLSRVLVL